MKTLLDRKLLTSLLNVIGSALCIPACILLLPVTFSNYLDGIIYFLVGCGLLTLAGAINVYHVCYSHYIESDNFHIFSSIATLLGGSCFFIGSVLFLPHYSVSIIDIGSWVFRVGSCCYLSSSFVKLYTLYGHNKDSNKTITTRTIRVVPLEDDNLESELQDQAKMELKMKLYTDTILPVAFDIGNGTKSVDTYENMKTTPLPLALPPALDSYLVSDHILSLIVIFSYIMCSTFYLIGGIISQLNINMTLAMSSWLIGSSFCLIAASAQLIINLRTYEYFSRRI